MGGDDELRAASSGLLSEVPEQPRLKLGVQMLLGLINQDHLVLRGMPGISLEGGVEPIQSSGDVRLDQWKKEDEDGLLTRAEVIQVEFILSAQDCSFGARSS